MSALRWWILFGWFPLFWFWNTPEQIRPDSRGARLAGRGASIAWIFFLLFLFLALFGPVGAYLFFEIMWIFFLFWIVGIWIFGCCNIGYFYLEANMLRSIGPYAETDKKDDDMEKMPTTPSTNLKSLKMQL